MSVVTTAPDGRQQLVLAAVLDCGDDVSDIGAFRGGRWPLEDFLKAIRLAVEWTIEHKAVFDFLAHPSCLLATDPKFESLQLICELVRAAGNKAQIVDLETIAKDVKLRPSG